MNQKDKVPKKHWKDKYFPFIYANREIDPETYKRYVKSKKYEPFWKLWKRLKLFWGKIKPTPRNIVAWILGILTLLFVQWIFKLLGLL